MSIKARPIRERFFAMVSPEPMSGCWLWTGTLNPNGYGIIFIRKGSSPGKAHRVSFEIEHGRPPASDLDHKCRNRACVNPSHLREVTHAENMRNGKYALATHCPSGHPYNEENTYLYVRGGKRQRICKACCLKRYHEGRAKDRRAA